MTSSNRYNPHLLREIKDALYDKLQSELYNLVAGDRYIKLVGSKMVNDTELNAVVETYELYSGVKFGIIVFHFDAEVDTNGDIRVNVLKVERP